MLNKKHKTKSLKRHKKRPCQRRNDLPYLIFKIVRYGIIISLNNLCYQKVSSWGLVPFEIVNLVPRYPFRLLTEFMF